MQRAPTPPSKGGGGGGGGSGSGGSRSNTPVLARYAVLQQRQLLPTMPANATAAAVGGVPALQVVQTTALVDANGVATGGAAVAAASATAAAAVGGAGIALAQGGEEPRSSTPARLSRVLSPLKGRLARVSAGSSSLAAGGEWGGVAAQQQQQQQAATATAAAEGARRRIERRSRRKLRRWANDRLVAVAQLAPGGAHLLDPETGELVTGAGGGATTGGDFAFFDAVADPQPTQFTALMAAEHRELRDRFLQGHSGPAAAGGRAAGRGARTALQEAEARFLRLERRLRAVLTRIVASDPGLEAFLAAVETLLRGFAQGDLPRASLDATDPALARSLLGPLRVETQGGSSSKGSSPTTTLVLPLRSSAFLRLVVHACARYYGLRSRSEDEEGQGEEEPCRAVLVTRPSTVAAGVGGTGNLGMTMRAFIRHSRLEQGRLKAGSKGRRLGGAEEGGAPALAAAEER